MNEEKNKEVIPDHGSTLKWSNDDEKSTKLLVNKYDGNIDGALKRFFESGGGTDYASARVLSIRFAISFGISEVEFMKIYRRWRKGQLS